MVSLLLLSVSCSRIVSTDYEVMEHGTVAAIDSINRSLSVRAIATDTVQTWYVDRPYVDMLSLWLVSYTNIAVGDTVYIYRDGGEMFASRCSIADVKDINEALCSWYWQNIAQNWYWFLLIFGIIALYTTGIIKSETGVFFAVVIGLAATYCLTMTGSRLSLTAEGTVTEITENYVKLDDAVIVSYATLNDLKMHQPITVGQRVTIYSAEYWNGRKIFLSSQKLNEAAIKAPQSYPEIWLKSFFLFLLGVLSGHFLFYYLQKWYKTKRSETFNP